MDFGTAFLYMFQDANWLRKLGIGTLLGLVGLILAPFLIGFIPLLMLMGYSLDVLKNVAERRAHPLPEWEDWGGFLVRGLMLAGASLIWSLPAVLAILPMMLGGALLEGDSGAGALGIVLVLSTSCLLMLWLLFFTLISPAIYARLACTRRFSAAFDFAQIWAFTRDNLGSVIIAIVLTWVAGLVAAIVGSLGLMALVIGVLVSVPFASFWQYLVQAHLFGQIAAQDATGIE